MIEICVLNYNSMDKLSYCLEALKRFTKVEHKITIIDNCSTDGSVKMLKYKGYEVVEHPVNLYFTSGFQKYLKTAKLPEYFVLMNNDCVVEPGWDKVLLEFMETHKDCGLVAPMLLSMDGRQVQNMGGLGDFYGHKAGVPEMYKAPEENFWTTFACVMIRTEAFLKINGMDENMRFYCSDSDFCLRLLIAGYKVYNIPTSRVRHFHMASTKQSMNEELINVMKNDQNYFECKWEFSGIRKLPQPIMEAKL